MKNDADNTIPFLKTVSVNFDTILSSETMTTFDLQAGYDELRERCTG